MQSIIKKKEGGTSIKGLTLSILCKIRTNYKLNMTANPKHGPRERSIIKANEIDDELHFVRFEGVYP